MKDELSLQNVKFDMKAIAEEIGVPLEKAHNIVQTALFEKGVEWISAVTEPYATNGEFLFVNADNKLSWYWTDGYPSYKRLFVKPQYSFYVKEEVETIEFNGKQYNKDDVAKALALLAPIN